MPVPKKRTTLTGFRDKRGVIGPYAARCAGISPTHAEPGWKSQCES